MKELFIKQLREFLRSDNHDDIIYGRLRGKLVGYLECDGMTPGEYELWAELIFMKKWGAHSYHYIAEMFEFNK